MADAEPVTASVTDHRIAPRGVLPRRTQTWLMVSVALSILGIILLLIIFFIRKEQTAALPISARDMTDAERKYYERQAEAS